jgi:aspartate-semialdehyde dehydrogenase
VLARELPLLLGVPELSVAATVVRAPVFFGTAHAVQVDLEREVSLAEVETAIRAAPGLLLAGSVEDRLMAAIETERRRKERAALVHEVDDQRDDREEIAEDGLEELEEERDGEREGGEGGEGGEYDEESEDPYAVEAREAARPKPVVATGIAAAEPLDLLPGPVDVAGSGFVHVVRLRCDPVSPQHLAFWIAFDELRRGVAMNLVSIVELVVQARG